MCIAASSTSFSGGVTSVPAGPSHEGAVSTFTSRQCIAHLDLKPCGCLEDTPANTETLAICNPEVYCCFFAPLSCSKNYGGYMIFEESGLLQFDHNFSFRKAYLEYRGFMPKINGEYQVPAVAFETLVEYTKWKAIKDRRNVNELIKERRKAEYTDAKKDMKTVLARTSIAAILNAVLTTPKFDYWVDIYNPCLGSPPVQEDCAPPVDLCASGGSGDGSGGSGDSSWNTPLPPSGCDTVSGLTPYTLPVIAGRAGGPVVGSSVYQNNLLKGAIGLNYIIVNNHNETIEGGNFTFDPAEGEIDRNPNTWAAGDVMIMPFFKNIVGTRLQSVELFPRHAEFIAGVGDGPVVGENTFQNFRLIGARELVSIIVNNARETSFDFNPVEGEITRDNIWADGDVLVLNWYSTTYYSGEGTGSGVIIDADGSDIIYG